MLCIFFPPLFKVMASALSVTRMCGRARWFAFAMSATTARTKAVASFAVDQACPTPTTAKNAPLKRRMCVVEQREGLRVMIRASVRFRVRFRVRASVRVREVERYGERESGTVRSCLIDRLHLPITVDLKTVAH